MNTMYKIEKNIPFSGKKRYDFPLNKMEVGDSFFVPILLNESHRMVRQRIYN